MENINNLIDKLNKFAELHTSLKEKIIEDSFLVDKLQKELNDNIAKLSEYENEYVKLIKKINELNKG